MAPKRLCPAAGLGGFSTDSGHHPASSAEHAKSTKEQPDEAKKLVLVGGWAGILHGHVRGTDEMNILVRATPEDSERVYKAFTNFGAPLSAHVVTAHHFANDGDAYRFGLAPLKIEVLTKISGVSYDEASDAS